MPIQFAADKKINILEQTLEEFRAQLQEMGVEKYRAAQIFEWIYQKGVYDFEKMTNLSVPLRKKLSEHLEIRLPEVAAKEYSKSDKSTKLLLKLGEKDFVEAVFMPVKDRKTVCISSQVGCKFHCAFCASGQNGFFRNLTMGEIMSQVLMARDLSPDKKLTNIVFMGIGEPFDNYVTLLKTLKMLNSPQGLGIGARKITVSTCGIAPKIEQMSKEGLQVELSISLHGANDATRGTIMPVNRAFPVKELIETCRKYVKKTKRAITFEYILIENVNASYKDAKDLAELLEGMLCKVNLIPYNPIEEFPHEQPNYENIVAFQQVLENAGIRTTVRFSKGREIAAACGQLRSVHTKEKKRGEFIQ